VGLGRTQGPCSPYTRSKHSCFSCLELLVPQAYHLDCNGGLALSLAAGFELLAAYGIGLHPLDLDGSLHWWSGVWVCSATWLLLLPKVWIKVISTVRSHRPIGCSRLQPLLKWAQMLVGSTVQTKDLLDIVRLTHKLAQYMLHLVPDRSQQDLIALGLDLNGTPGTEY